MLGGGSAASRVFSYDDVQLDVLSKLLDLQRSRFIDSSVAPDFDNAPPVGVVDAACPHGDGV